MFKNMDCEGDIMKASRLLHLSALMALSLMLGCASKTPADNSSAGSPSPAAGAAGGSAAGGNSSSASNNAADSKVAAPKPAPEPLVIPIGKAITVRLGETLSSNGSQDGQSFTATVSAPVEVQGKTVIPAGAPAIGTVVAAKGMGHFKGGALLQVRLTSVTIHGHEHQITSSIVSHELKGKGKRSTIAISGGAAAGAIIGALAGGGKGAAIGAGAGAGAGTAGAGLTGNKQITLPAESSITFTLKQAVEVK
jgi:hypothetical protein